MCYNGILFISGQQLFTKFQGDFVLFEFWTNDFLDTNSDAYINLIQALSEDVSHSLSVRVCFRYKPVTKSKHDGREITLIFFFQISYTFLEVDDYKRGEVLNIRYVCMLIFKGMFNAP